MKWMVYATPHPALDFQVIGTYRWRWIAQLRAWWYEHLGLDGACLWPTTRIETT